MTKKNWFIENKLNINYNTKIIECLIKNSIQPSSILEIGCANGFQLDYYRSFFNHKKLNKNLFGVDISKKAINEGKKNFPNLNLFHLDSLEIFKLKKKFDLIICGFFLYFLDRKKIFKQFDQIIECLNSDGFLIIHDFDPLFPHHNIHKKNKYTVYKSDYSKLLEASNIFKKIHYVSYEIKNKEYLSNSRSITLYKLIDFRKNFPKNI